MPAAGSQRISTNSARAPASVSPTGYSSTKSVDAAPALLVNGERATTKTKAEDEEDLWAQALDEFNGAGRKQGVWAKAFAQASGNESAAQAQYLSERFGQLSEERAKVHRAEVERVAKLQRAEKLVQEEVAQLESATGAALAADKNEPMSSRDELLRQTEHLSRLAADRIKRVSRFDAGFWR
jgi:hypothetical protein